MRYLQEMGNILVMISIIFCCDCLRCVCYPFVFVFNFTLPFHFIFPREYFGSCGDISNSEHLSAVTLLNTFFL